MKLVFWAGMNGDELPIKVLGRPTVPISWSKLHWALTEEDWVRPTSATGRFFNRLGFRSYRQPKWIPQLYSDFTTLCLPEGGFAHAILSPIWGIGGFLNLLNSLNASRLQSFALSEKGKKRETLIVELQREHVGTMFEDNSWEVGQHFLLISKEKIGDWPERLKSTITAGGFDFDLLNSLEAIVWNYWEHGIEAASTILDIDFFRQTASRVSDRLKVPLEVEETTASNA